MILPHLIITLTGLGSLCILTSIYTHLWQRKEYRWDRFKTLLQPGSDRDFIISKLMALTVAFIALGWLLALSGWHMIAELFGQVSLFLVAFDQLRRIKQQGLLRPQFTTKASVLMTTTVFVTLVYLFFFYLSSLPALTWSTVVIAVPFFSATSVLLINIPFDLRKKSIIREAAKKRQQISELTVIGITGSFGKTSTKHFLYHLLVDKNTNLIKVTQAHHNTEIGVAQDILAQLTPETSMYIAEMGAYKKGEIKALCELAKPKIGVVTAISNQHLELFGSLGNIAQAKWELIEALPPDGIAVLNKDDQTTQQKATNIGIKTIWYSAHETADVYTSEVSIQPLWIDCMLHLGPWQKKIRLPLASQGLLSSAVAAAAIAYVVKQPAEKIAARLTTLKPFPRTMQVYQGLHGATIIDDSYSANEAGVINAIEHLKKFSQPDKRMVLAPLIELGEQASHVHRRIGATFKNIQVKIIVTGQQYQKEMQAAAGPHADIQFMTDPQKILAQVTTNISNKTAILLEGRIPDLIRQKLT